MRLSIVIPCYNEADNVGELYKRLSEVVASIDGEIEYVFVDDGSRDSTFAKLGELSRRDSRVRAISLSRNFGHQAALSAGIDHATGDAVVIMDADLQHPPDLIPKFIEMWNEGYDLVYAYREGVPTRFGYKVINSLMKVEVPAESADFKLMDRKVVDAFCQMPERSRFIRGMFSWLGFRQIGVAYSDGQRFAGQRSYTIRQTARLAMHAVLSFSNVPLRVASFLGMFTIGLGLIYAVYILSSLIAQKEIERGWTGIMMTILILGGVQLLCLGIMAEYIGRIFEEVKRRPLYVIRERIGRPDREQTQAVASKTESTSAESVQP